MAMTSFMIRKTSGFHRLLKTASPLFIGKAKIHNYAPLLKQVHSNEQDNEQGSLQQQLKIVQKELAEHRTELRGLGQSILVPVTVAIVYKALFKALTNCPSKPIGSPKYDNITGEIYQKSGTHYSVLGFASEADMRHWAEDWKDTVLNRNLVAHTVTGENVIHCLKYATGTKSMVLRVGFQKFWGMQPEEWQTTAVNERKDIVLTNSSDEELAE